MLLLNAQKYTQQARWQQKVDYNIAVSLDPVKKLLDANMEIHYYNNSPDTLKSIWLHVWPNAYKNDQTAFAQQLLKNNKTDFHFSDEDDRGSIDGFHFMANNDSLKWRYDSTNIDILELQLNTSLLPGQNLSISTPFKVKLPKIFSRCGFEGDFFAITQWYPKPAVYDVNGWNTMPYLDQGEFYSEFGDFTVNISVPREYKVAATGNLIYKGITNINDSTSLKTYTYKEHNIHDFAWFTTPFFLTQKRTIILDNGDSVNLNYYKYSKNLASDMLKKGSENLTWPIERGITEYSRQVGNYPYKNCSVVIGPLAAGAGMEYPTITVCSSNDKETIIHEVGHNWFYGMLGTNERRYPWMDESINTFYEQKISGKLIGDAEFYKNFKGKSWVSNYETLTAYLFSAKQGLSQPLNIPSEEFTNMNYGAIVYCKGPVLFAYLQQQLGDSLFEKCMKDYFTEWQYKHPLPGDMQTSFEKSSGLPLGWFFNDLLNENNTIDIAKNRHGYVVKGSEKLDTFLMKKNYLNANPFGFLPEKNYLNNGQKLKLISIAFPPRITRQNAIITMNVTPIMGANYYDKLYLGAAFYNRTLFRHKFEYIAIPAYAFGSKKMVGYGKINYLIFPKSKRLFKTEAGVQGQSFGLKYFSHQNQYYRINPYLKFYFKHKGSVNDQMDKQLLLNFYHTGLQSTTYLIKDSIPAAYFFNYYKLTYSIENKKAINSYLIKLNTEYGYNYKFSPGANSYLKIWANGDYKYNYAPKKFFKSSVFAGLFLYKKGDISRQEFYMSGNSGERDYLYSEALAGRSENIFDNNIFGHQVINVNGNMRNILPSVPTDRWMISAANEISLPGLIPFRIYADLCVYNYLQIINTSSGIIQRMTKPKVHATAGITLPLFHELLEIFVPIFQSKQFLQFNQYNYSIANSIGFKLNLNKLDPYKQIENFRQ